MILSRGIHEELPSGWPDKEIITSSLERDIDDSVKIELRKKFEEFCALFLNFFAFWRQGIDVLAKLFGVYYPPAILFMLLFFALIVYSLHLSIVISKHKEQIKNLNPIFLMF